MATMTVEECRKYLTDLDHLPDEEIIKIRDNLTFIINSILKEILYKGKIKPVPPPTQRK